MSRKRVQQRAFRMLSQIGISYRDSPLSQAVQGLPSDAPHPGDRFPWLHLKMRPNGPVEDLFEALDDTRFNLLVLGQPVPSGNGLADGDLLAIHSIPDDPENTARLRAAHVPSPAFFLLRPDGHVGLAGVRAEAAALAWYLDQFGIRTHAAPATSLLAS
jgi:hypothetical protein